MNFIMDEKAYAENVLNNSNCKKIDGQTVTILAKYYKSQGLSEAKIKAELEKFIDGRDPTMLIKTKNGLIKTSVKNAKKYPLYDIKIAITKPEMELINSLTCPPKCGFKAETLRKFAFTLLCFTKFEAAKGVKDGWTRTKKKFIFAAANIKTTIRKQAALLHQLAYCDPPLVELGMKIGYEGIKVLFQNEGDVEVIVDNLNESGLIFEQYNGKKFIKCETCGKRVRVTNGRSRFCKECAVERDRMLARERRRLERQKSDLFDLP